MSVSVNLCPIWCATQFFDANGDPLAGGQIYQFEAGSFTVQQTTYSDNTGDTPNPQPIVLDSSGRNTTAIWLQSGDAYNLVLEDSSNVFIDSLDDIIGIQASSSVTTSTSIWTKDTDAPVFLNGTQFQLTGNVVADFAVGNRVQIEYPGPTFLYGTVSSVSFSSPNTQVTLINDTSVQNSGMLFAYWSLATVAGKIVDAGAVTYSNPGSYSAGGTVGHQLDNTTAAAAVINTNVANLYQVWPTSGSGANTPYTITTGSDVTSYANGQRFTVNFGAASAGSPTMSVNGLSALPLVQYTPGTGAVEAAVTQVNQVSDIGYDGTNFVLQDPLQQANFDPSTIAHGQTVVVSNLTFTVPANVYSLNVLCVGAGGGGGGGDAGPGPDWTGGNGGIGGAGIGQITTTPGSTFTVSIGAGGTGGTFTGVNGTNGGATTFGSTVVQGTGGAGGTGASGANGTNGVNGHTGAGGYGAYATLYTVSTSIKAAGGLGALGATATGGAGSPGLCIITW